MSASYSPAGNDHERVVLPRREHVSVVLPFRESFRFQLNAGFIIKSVRFKCRLRRFAQAVAVFCKHCESVIFTFATVEHDGETGGDVVADGEFDGLVFRGIAVGADMYPDHL